MEEDDVLIDLLNAACTLMEEVYHESGGKVTELGPLFKRCAAEVDRRAAQARKAAEEREAAARVEAAHQLAERERLAAEVKARAEWVAREKAVQEESKRAAEQAIKEHLAYKQMLKEKERAREREEVKRAEAERLAGEQAARQKAARLAEEAEQERIAMEVFEIEAARRAAEQDKADYLAAQKVAAQEALAREKETMRRQKEADTIAKKAAAKQAAEVRRQAAAEGARQQALRKRKDKEEEAARKAAEKAAKKASAAEGITQNAGLVAAESGNIHESPLTSIAPVGLSASPHKGGSAASSISSGRLERSQQRTSRLRNTSKELMATLEGVVDDHEAQSVSYTMYSALSTSAAKCAIEEDQRMDSVDNARSTIAALDLNDPARPVQAIDTQGSSGVTMADIIAQCKILASEKGEELQDLLDQFNAYRLPKKQLNMKLRNIMGIEKVREALAAVIPDQVLNSEGQLRAVIKQEA